MGNNVVNNEQNPYVYMQFQSAPAKPGETRILRRPDTVDKELVTKNLIDQHTQLDCIEYYMKRRPNGNFLGTREYFPNEKKYGKYIWKSYTQVYNLSKYFLYGIEKLNLCPDVLVDDDYLGKNTNHKFLGIYSRNREEWLISSFGSQMNSIIIVTLYDTLGMSSIEFIINQTELQTIVIESKNISKIHELMSQKRIEKLKYLILLRCHEENVEEVETNIKKCEEVGLKIINYDDIINTGKKCVENNETEIINKEYKKAKPESIYTICYTSGTGGSPKGALVTQHSITLATNVMYTIGYHLSEVDRIYSFLPLAHIMEQLIFSVCLVYGTQTGFSSGSLTRLLEDLQQLKPTYFCAVPRVFEKVYSGIMEKINKKGTIIQKLFEKGLEIKINNYKKYGILYHPFYDTLFFNKTKSLVGGEMKWFLTGGAPLQIDIIDKLKVMFCCPMVQGYGQTENCGSALLNSIYDTISGTTGGCQNTTEMKLVDLPEFGYFSTDKNEVTNVLEPRGEICFRGDTVFKGFFKISSETKRVLDEEGWYHSGDVGVVLTNQGNAVKIIDRAKSLFKLSQGEYVAPEKIQTILVKSKYINQIFLHGESLYSYAVAIIYPELTDCVKFLVEKNGGKEEDYNIDNILDNKDLIEEIIKDCDDLGRKNDLKGFELPKKILLIKEPFSLENNLLTPTLKLKIKLIKKKYEKEINEMYGIK